MQDKMKKIKGYFRVDQIDTHGNIIDTYENNNTIMARVPQIIAGQTSGFYQEEVKNYTIATIALGTDGISKDVNGNDIIKSIRDNRSMLFSEDKFWNDDDTNPLYPDSEKRVYQMTFGVSNIGDSDQNTTIPMAVSINNQGSTIPHTNNNPDKYRDYSPLSDQESLSGTVSLRQNVIEYTWTLGQFAGNHPTDIAIPYNEAAMYYRYNANNEPKDVDAQTGKPLGTMFSMKTFPSVYKNSTCSIKITWKLFF